MTNKITLYSRVCLPLFQIFSCQIENVSYEHTDGILSPERPLKIPPLVAGYTLILDNLDCYIKVRDMTSEHHNKLVHYVNVSIPFSYVHNNIETKKECIQIQLHVLRASLTY